MFVLTQSVLTLRLHPPVKLVRLNMELVNPVLFLLYQTHTHTQTVRLTIFYSHTINSNPTVSKSG